MHRSNGAEEEVIEHWIISLRTSIASGDVRVILAVTLAAGLILLLVGEWQVPDRAHRRVRWPTNIALGIVNVALVRLFSMLAPVGAAIAAARYDIGVFNAVDLPPWAVTISAIIIMDFAIYWQHRAFHQFRWGWALHRLHHADTAMDVTTAVRFNPAEALVSMAYKALLTLALGLPLIAVVMFEAWLALGSLIEHSNIRLSLQADRAIRRFWVTPAMHRVHHSAHGDDYNHNYGFAIALWDRLFKSYQATPSGAKIGLPPTGAAG